MDEFREVEASAGIVDSRIDLSDRIIAISEELLGVSQILMILQAYEGANSEHLLTLAKVCERHSEGLQEIAGEI